MARPKKKGVDYFPHDCVTGKTIFTLELKYGNDGYAFWFKLLEFLGTKEGHYLDCSDLEEMEFLQAKTHLDEVTMYKILDTLANLNAIDRELWQKKVIWSQRFVDGVSVVYTNRRVETPSKPSFYIVSTGDNPANGVVSTPESTQSRVEYSIVDKIKEENTPPNGDSDQLKKNNMSTAKDTKDIPLPFKEEKFAVIWAEWLQYRRENRYKAFTPTGLKRTFNKLLVDSGGDCDTAIEMIDNAMAKSWQGIHALKQQTNGTHQRKPSEVGKTIEFDRP